MCHGCRYQVSWTNADKSRFRIHCRSRRLKEIGIQVAFCVLARRKHSTLSYNFDRSLQCQFNLSSVLSNYWNEISLRAQGWGKNREDVKVNWIYFRLQQIDWWTTSWWVLQCKIRSMYEYVDNIIVQGKMFSENQVYKVCIVGMFVEDNLQNHYWYDQK